MKNVSNKATKIVADLPINLDNTPSVGQDFDYEKAIIEGTKLADEQLSFGNVRKFPLEVYPKFMQDFVKECNGTLLHPVDFISSAILWTVAASIGNQLKVQVKTTRENKSTIFLCFVGRPNSMKSEPMQLASLPLQQKNSLALKEYRDDVDRRGEEKADPLKRYLVKDYTPETYMTYLADNPHGCSVLVDEFAGHVGNYGRYSGSSEVSNWLSIWSGLPMQVDRKGRKEEINNTFACILGSTQYDILKGIWKTKKELTQNGYFDRVLFVAPNGLKKQPDNDKDLDPLIYEMYKHHINKILDINKDKDIEKEGFTTTIKIGLEAKKVIGEFKEDLRVKCDNSNDKISSMLGKFDIIIYRLALIMQAMYWSCEESELSEISEKAAKAAVKLALYFIDNSTKIHNFMSDKTAAVKLESDVLKWYNALPRNGVTTEMALKLAAKMRQKGASALSEAYVYIYLRRGDLFEKIGRGVYDRVG